MNTSIKRDLPKVDEATRERLINEYEKIRDAYGLQKLDFNRLVALLHKFVLQHANKYEDYINFDITDIR
jgi:hypothetical protein